MEFKSKKRGFHRFRERKKKKPTSSYFTCKAKARIPAANGADAEVPVCPMVHVFFKSVVTWNTLLNYSTSPKNRGAPLFIFIIQICKRFYPYQSKMWWHTAHYHLIVVSSAAVRRGHCRRTAFTVPWKSSGLTSRAHCDRINASYVSIASAVVRFQTSITRSPHVNTSLAVPALDNMMIELTRSIEF